MQLKKYQRCGVCLCVFTPPFTSSHILTAIGYGCWLLATPLHSGLPLTTLSLNDDEKPLLPWLRVDGVFVVRNEYVGGFSSRLSLLTD